MTGPGAPGAPGMHGRRWDGEYVEAGRRSPFRPDERPVVAVPDRSSAAAAVFPREKVLRLDVDRAGATTRRTVHSLLFAALIFAWAQMFTGGRATLWAAVGLPDETWLSVALIIVLGFMTLAVVAMDESTVVAWEMFAVGGVVALVEILRTDPSVVAILVACGPLWAWAYFWRRLRRTRQVRWRRLRQVVDDHQLVEARVVRHRWHSTSGSSAVHRLRIVLASPQVPGQQWDVELSPDRRQIDAAPETGDRVLMFVCPADVEVAVVRPVLPA